MNRKYLFIASLLFGMFGIGVFPGFAARVPHLLHINPVVGTMVKERLTPIFDKSAIRVPIVLYHHIRPITPAMNPLARGLSVTPEVFDAQLSYFEKNGFTTITLDQFYSALQKKTTLPKKPIILSFDDGYRDNFTNAYPLLAKHHFMGSFFIFTQAMGAPDYVTWDQVKEMQRSGVFEIGSHTLSHADLPHISESKVHAEIFESKKIIEEHLGIPVPFFCYPYGHYTKHIVDEVKKAGYLGALTTHYGTVHTVSSLFEVTRVRLTNDDFGVRLDKKMKLFLR